MRCTAHDKFVQALFKLILCGKGRLTHHNGRPQIAWILLAAVQQCTWPATMRVLSTWAGLLPAPAAAAAAPAMAAAMGWLLPRSAAAASWSASPLGQFPHGSQATICAPLAERALITGTLMKGLLVKGTRGQGATQGRDLPGEQM